MKSLSREEHASSYNGNATRHVRENNPTLIKIYKDLAAADAGKRLRVFHPPEICNGRLTSARANASRLSTRKV